ncbi:MAG: hypothetical protein PVG19_03285, partial [Desulfobacterales bacterium]
MTLKTHRFTSTPFRKSRINVPITKIIKAMGKPYQIVVGTADESMTFLQLIFMPNITGRPAQSVDRGCHASGSRCFLRLIFHYYIGIPISRKH